MASDVAPELALGIEHYQPDVELFALQPHGLAFEGREGRRCCVLRVVRFSEESVIAYDVRLIFAYCRIVSEQRQPLRTELVGM
jgi:hypothetical protein